VLQGEELLQRASSSSERACNDGGGTAKEGDVIWIRRREKNMFLMPRMDRPIKRLMRELKTIKIDASINRKSIYFLQLFSLLCKKNIFSPFHNACY
jgi:hypothetical protein